MKPNKHNNQYKIRQGNALWLLFAFVYSDTKYLIFTVFLQVHFINMLTFVLK